MASSSYAVAQSLYSISDALQVPLALKNGELEGGARAAFLPAKGVVRMPFTITPLAMFSAEQTGVLFHIRGDLYFLVSHYSKSGSTSLYILDQSKSALNLKNLIEPNANLRTVIEEIRHCVVEAFHYKDQQWHPLSLPS